MRYCGIDLHCVRRFGVAFAKHCSRSACGHRVDRVDTAHEFGAYMYIYIVKFTHNRYICQSSEKDTAPRKINEALCARARGFLSFGWASCRSSNVGHTSIRLASGKATSRARISHYTHVSRIIDDLCGRPRTHAEHRWNSNEITVLRCSSVRARPMNLRCALSGSLLPHLWYMSRSFFFFVCALYPFN